MIWNRNHQRVLRLSSHRSKILHDGRPPLIKDEKTKTHGWLVWKQSLCCTHNLCNGSHITDTQNSGRLGQRAMTNSKSWYFHTHSHDVIIALKILNLVSDDEVHSCSLYLIHPFPVCAVSKLNSVVPLGCWSTITCIALLYLLFGDRKSTKNLKNNNARTYRLFKLPSAKCRCQK